MSVRTDVVNLQINVNGNKAQAELGNLRKRAADLTYEMKGLKKGTEEYRKKAEELKQVQSRMDGLKKSIGVTSLTLKELIREQSRLNNLRSNVPIGTKEWKDYNSQLKEVQDRLSQVRQGMNTTGSQKSGGILKDLLSASAITYAIDKTVEFGKAVIDTRAEFQRLEAVLKNTLGSDSLAIRALKDISEFAAETPFSVQELTASFVKLANAGFAPTTNELRKLGDLASSMGKSFDQLAEAIIDAQTGEFERLKEFGIRAKKEGDKVQFTFKGVTTEVGNTEAAIRSYITALGDAEGVSGAMSAISQTLGGQISNLGDSWDQMLNTVGEGTQGVFSGAIKIIKDTIDSISEYISELNKIEKYKLDENDGPLPFFSSLFGKNDSEKAVDNIKQFTQGLEANFDDGVAKLKENKEAWKSWNQAIKDNLLQPAFKAAEKRGLEGEKRAILDAYNQFSKEVMDTVVADIAKKAPKKTAAPKVSDKDLDYQRRLKELEEFMKRAATLKPAEIAQAAQELDLPIKINVKYETDPQKIRESLERTSDALMQSNLEFLGRRKASLELKANITTGREQLDNVIASLETEQAERIAFAEQTGEEVADIEEYYRQAKVQAITDSFVNEAQQYVAYAQAAASILDAFIQARNQRDQQELAKFKKQADTKKKIEEQRLKSGLLSQAQYNKKIAELDDQAEKKQRELAIKQFKRNQKMQIITANINIAQAVLQALAGSPPPANYILAAAVGIAGAIQLATISKQQPPEARHGLIIPGNTSHSDGGIDLYDRKQKRVIANVESGEPLWVFSRETYKNNKPVLDQLMYNSQNRKGASILPSFDGAYAPINSSKLVPLMQNGGIVNPGGTSAATNADAGMEVFNAMLVQVAGLRDDMNSWSTRLKADVSYFEIKEKETLLQQSQAASGLNQ